LSTKVSRQIHKVDGYDVQVSLHEVTLMDAAFIARSSPSISDPHVPHFPDS